MYMSSNVKPNRTLDFTGLFCPEPVLKTSLELSSMNLGEVLEVAADDPAAEEDIKSLIKRTGNELLKMRREGNVIRFIIRKVK